MYPKPLQSNNIKGKKIGSDKSLNKSVDSRNNSAKSDKLKVSQEKLKDK